MDQIKIGNFIKECRKELGITQYELADKLNVSFKTISKWECGKGYQMYLYFYLFVMS